ncbi:hypothetical protein B0H14DRAFT_2583764 [Mycena olivaceomarginata]|nr:hypothetical protein B0H14DRAFT_2583764 [Mycena olivaceomarginata]
MSSGPQILIAGALNFLQDLSNGSNIPALQPLMSVAVRIYTSAEQEDRQELSHYRTKITEAKLQFLVSLRPRLLPRSKSVQVAMEMEKSQTLQREQKYPVFTLVDLELRQTLNQTNPKHTKAVARLVPHQKLVVLRQYHMKSLRTAQSETSFSCIAYLGQFIGTAPRKQKLNNALKANFDAEITVPPVPLLLEWRRAAAEKVNSKSKDQSAPRSGKKKIEGLRDSNLKCNNTEQRRKWQYPEDKMSLRTYQGPVQQGEKKIECRRRRSGLESESE